MATAAATAACRVRRGRRLAWGASRSIRGLLEV
jgi:hypothetical protein